MKLLRYSSGSFFPGAILLSSYRPRIARKTYDLPEKMCSLYRATAALAWARANARQLEKPSTGLILDVMKI